MRNNFVKILIGFAILFIAFNPLYAQRANDFRVTLNNSGDGLIITSYTGNTARITIPARIDGIPVIEIGEGAFYRNNTITNVTISNGIQRIAASAFKNCNNLTTLVIPDSVTEIVWDAIGYCQRLTSITLPRGLTVLPSLAGCGFTSFRIPDGIVEILRQAFLQCPDLTSVTIPSSVRKIGDDAFFMSNKLTTVNLPQRITIEFGDNVFDDTNLSVSSQSVLRNAGYRGRF